MNDQGATDLGKGTMYHSYTKHIHVRFHQLRGMIEVKVAQLKKIQTDKNVLNMLIKVVPKIGILKPM